MHDAPPGGVLDRRPMLKLFDLECLDCGHRFEALVRHTTDPSVERSPTPSCESCRIGATTLRPGGLHSFKTIQATTNTSKPFKAAYADKIRRPASGKQFAVGGPPQRLHVPGVASLRDGS